MMVRLVFGVVLVANILVLVFSSDAETTQATTTSESPAITTIASSDASSSPSSEAVTTSKPKCRRVKKCPKNEEFSSCVQSLSRAQNCSEKAEPISSPETTETTPDESSCKKACVCKENYLRAKNGTCIPAEQCPLKCGDNEVLDNCPSDCASDYCPTEDVSEAASCVTPDVCPAPVCKCAFNHRRAANGSCIPTRDCPPFACKTNEEFNACPPLCPTDDCSQASPTGQCPPQFGHIGIILPCNPKCRCIKDYWRLDGICVPYGQCPGVCPDNERYSECLQAECRALNCTQKDQSIPCPRIDPKYCEKGCVCEEGYLRNGDGLCILEDKCEPPLTCGDDEVLDNCPSDCASDYCPTEDVSDAATCTTPDVCPPPVCKCGFNRRRASNGSCILTRDCPPYACKTNEEFNACPPLCPTDDCSQASPTGECPPQFGQILIILPCNPKCRCIKDYWRLDGICVPYGQCPGVCPANERYSGCLQGECKALNCTQKDQSIACARIDPKYCEKGCVCEEGYLRNQDGLCVLEDKCEPTVCPAHERYSECLQGECKALYCAQKDQSIPCPRIDPKYCKKGCVCEEGYLRNQDGLCVLEDKCEPTVCLANERYSGCLQGECKALNCTQKDQSIPCARIDPKYCEKGCVCEEGYLRNQDGLCVLEDKCEPTVCPAHERYSECLQGECKALYCAQKDQSIPCPRIDPKYCKKGCVCEEDYLRNQDGLCVLEDKCEPTVCPAHERYSECLQGECKALNCTQKDQSIPCPRIDPKYCEKGCVCEEGYLRNQDGLCVLEDKCEPTFCPAHERYSECLQGECKALYCAQKDQSIPCPRIDPKYCKKGCVCEEGYLRNQDGLCVLEDKCEPTVCPDHERYSECLQGECKALYCTQKDESIPCPRIDPKYCKKGCVCEEGYLRNQDGLCVLEDKCEPLQTSCISANEEYVPCMQGVCRAKICSEKGQDVPCPDVPKEQCDSGCICKEHFLRAANGTCVPEDKCELTSCPINEEFSNCTQTLCQPQECYDRYLSIPCPDVPAESCEKGCVCKWGYLRDLNNVCIPSDECPTNPCEFNKRPTNCTLAKCIQKCFQEERPQSCPFVKKEDCKEGCVCQEGYLEAEDGYCVPEEKCESTKCPPFEQWSFCSNAVCRAKDCSQKGLLLPCPSVSQCDAGCLCQGGYLRDESGVCIPEVECNARDCSANEEWTACAINTCRTQNCTEKGKPFVCPMITDNSCEEACVCKENFLRNENGSCVPEDKCEPQLTCGDNEVLDECPPTCNSDNCPQSADDEEKWCAQADPCVPACKCKFNYKRAANGTCIPTKNCPPFDCSAKPNEEYVSCPPYCPSDECGKPRLTGECPFKIGTVLQCKPQCQCKEGYGRVNDTCVPFAECPNLCPTNETYSACMQQKCSPEKCAGRYIIRGTCPPVEEASCKKGCVCQQDFYRNDTGVCVSYKECEAPECPANEEWSTCAQATCRAQNCTEKGKPVMCPMIMDGFCEEACVCKENYLRNENGECVPEDQCEPQQLTCGDNEVLDDCPPTCNTDNCPLSADDSEEVWCAQADPCVPACKCRFNYKRAANGTCIPTKSCPPFDCSAKPNEEYVSCPPFCPSDACGKPRLTGRCPFRIGIVLQCKPKCQCKDGYGRVNETCVPFAECPNLCPANETYSPCVQQTCRQQNCSNRDVAMETCPTVDKPSCTRGCVCQDNFYRNEEGVCISYEDCGGPMCPNAHEVYTPNFRKCPPNICNSLVAKYKCAGDQKEEPACACESGYLRLNETSPCIPICECPEMKSSPDCNKTSK